jgi:hypothetical protein
VQQRTEFVDEDVTFLALDQFARVEAMRIDVRPPCILPLPAMKQSARLLVDGSPQPPRVGEPEKKQGAPSAGFIENPNSCLGGEPSRQSQGRVMCAVHRHHFNSCNAISTA